MHREKERWTLVHLDSFKLTPLKHKIGRGGVEYKKAGINPA